MQFDIKFCRPVPLVLGGTFRDDADWICQFLGIDDNGVYPKTNQDDLKLGFETAPRVRTKSLQQDISWFSVKTTPPVLFYLRQTSNEIVNGTDVLAIM